MKKILSVGLLAIIIFVISLVVLDHQQLKNNTSASSRSSVTSQVTVEDKSCHEIDNFTKKIPHNKDDSYIRQFVLTTLIHDDAFLQLEKIALINSECGASAASYLVKLYVNLNMPEKSKEYHQKIINYANSNNISAISNLCDSYDSLVNAEQKLHFCRIVLDEKSKKFDSGIKFAALNALSSYYFALNQGDKLFELCEKSGDNKDVCLFSDLFTSVNSLALKFYKQKNFEEAFNLFKKIAPYDATGITQSQLGDMYQSGEGIEKNSILAIFWYKKALEKNYNPPIRSAILNNLGVAYEDQLDYTSAFQCYKDAATMGYSLSQMNLAFMYSKGYGIIQDNQQAYAWISIAISKGLEDRDKQIQAEKIKSWLTYSLRVQDKNGTAFQGAQVLTQQYYKKYILHESSTNNKSITAKIKDAIKILTN